MFKKFIMATICSLGLAAPALAGDIQVKDGWAAMMDGRTDHGDVFVTLTNTGATPDRLYAVKTKVAKVANLEYVGARSVHKGEGERASSILVLPNETVTFNEKGSHIQLAEMLAPLKAGQTFVITLFFENAGPVKANVVVKKDAHQAREGHEQHGDGKAHH